MKPFALKRKATKPPAERLTCFSTAVTESSSSASDGPGSSSAPQQLSRLLEEGAALAEADQWEEALRRFNAAARLNPCSAAAHEQRAQVLLELGQTFEAIQAAEAACGCDLEWGDAHVTLGRSQLNHGEFRLALASLERAVTLRCVAPAEVELEALEVDALLCESHVRERLQAVAIDLNSSGR